MSNLLLLLIMIIHWLAFQGIRLVLGPLQPPVSLPIAALYTLHVSKRGDGTHWLATQHVYFHCPYFPLIVPVFRHVSQMNHCPNFVPLWGNCGNAVLNQTLVCAHMQWSSAMVYCPSCEEVKSWNWRGWILTLVAYLHVWMWRQRLGSNWLALQLWRFILKCCSVLQRNWYYSPVMFL